MAEDTKGTTNPVQVTQEPAMPTGQQKISSEGQIDQGAASTEKVTPQAESNEGLPSETSERTKREFDKLREQLRTEREARLYTERVFSQIQPQNQPIKPDEPKPLYDPNTGLLNEGVFSDVQRKAYEAEERAKKAEAAVQAYQQNQIRGEDERQRKEAITAYPELDSESKAFDKDLHVQVRRILTDSMINPNDYGGNTLTYKEAADIAKGVNKVVINQAKQQGAQEAIEQLTPKEQASLEATGNPARRQEVSTPLPDLQARTRRGDLDAIVQRLKNIPVVGKG